MWYKMITFLMNDMEDGTKEIEDDAWTDFIFTNLLIRRPLTLTSNPILTQQNKTKQKQHHNRMAETKEQLATILPSAGKDRDVKLHPLVLINISDHFTREKVRSKTSPIYSQSERVAGVLFGVQTGKVVDVLESFEMKYEILDSGVLQFDEEFLVNKKQQCKFLIIFIFLPHSFQSSGNKSKSK